MNALIWIAHHWVEIIAAYTGIVYAARIIVKLTPTPDDDTKLEKVIDTLKHIGLVVKDTTAMPDPQPPVGIGNTKIPLALLLGLGLFASSVQAQQPTNAPTPSVTSSNDVTGSLQAGLQMILDSLYTGRTNWYLEAHGLYADKLQQHYGGGAGFFYPLSEYVVTGIRADWVDGGFWMPSGNATLQVPLRPIHGLPWFVVTPFGYAGIGVPVSGATIANIKVPGKSIDNNGEPTAILGYGGALLLYAPKGGNWSMNAVFDRETWSGFPGFQYRAGLAFHKKF